MAIHQHHAMQVAR